MPAAQAGPDLFALCDDVEVPRDLRPAPPRPPDPQPGPDLFDGAADAPRRVGGCVLTLEPQPGSTSVRPTCAPCGWKSAGTMQPDLASVLFDRHAAERAGQ